MAAGCDGFIAKPFRAEEIYDCLSRLLGVTFEIEAVGGQSVAESALDVEHIVLPDDLAARLSRAAEMQSATALRGCVLELDRLDANGARLADHVRSRLATCDMEAIQRIVGRLPTTSLAC